MIERPMEAVIDCTTGELSYDPMPARDWDALQAQRKTEADTEASRVAAHAAKVAAAKQVLATRPELQTILDALGVKLQ